MVQNQEYGLQETPPPEELLFMGEMRNFLHRQVKGRYKWRGVGYIENNFVKKSLKPVSFKNKRIPGDRSSMEQATSLKPWRST